MHGDGLDVEDGWWIRAEIKLVGFSSSALQVLQSSLSFWSHVKEPSRQVCSAVPR